MAIFKLIPITVFSALGIWIFTKLHEYIQKQMGSIPTYSKFDKFKNKYTAIFFASILTLTLVFIMVLLGLLNWFNKRQTYLPFTVDVDETTGEICEHYYQECVCYGGLTVMESYPMQYFCDGRASCKDIDETVCRDD